MKQVTNAIFFYIACILLFGSCGKGDGGGSGGGGNSNPCSGITITIDAIVTNPSAPAATDGSIMATATGSSGIVFSINGGAFQSSGSFTNLAAGTYTISAKNGNNCSGSKSVTLIAQNSCAGVTITVNSSTTTNIPCTSAGTGSITITITGGVAPFTYSLDGGVFQSSNLFSGISSGAHSIIVKDANGCTGSANATVTDVPAGPLFSAVRSLMQTNCILSGCHADVQPPLFAEPCTIITNRFLIKARAVDSDPSPMPPNGLLSASERQKITDWLNAGGHFNN
jgi:SprB repeat